MRSDWEILKITVWIYGVIFGAATLATLLFRRTNWGRNMKAAIFMWFVIFLLFMGAAYAGWLPFCCLIVLISFGAVREFYVINGIRSKLTMFIAGVLILVMAAAIETNRMYLFYSVPGLSILIFFPVHLFRRSYEEVLKTVSLQVLGITYWGWLTMHFLLLRRLDCGFGAIVVLTSMIALNDNSAYYVGKFLGKNSPKFSPRISPNKTWVGFFGGFAASVIASFAFAYALPDILLWHRLVLAVTIACAIPTGDLIESAMKRDLGVKDSGTLIPGHGGVLDRFDSWAFTAPVVYYSLVFLSMVRA